jgi:hypothetical protein
MSKHHTSPEIQSSSIKLLTNWHDFGQPLPARHFSTAIAPAFLEQQEIGVYNFLLGRVSSQLTQLQDSYLMGVDTKQNCFVLRS